MSTQIFDVDAARKAFPALALQDHQVYFDNAGGSQVLSSVANSIKDYLEETNVQLGASYNVAKQSTESYDKGLEAAASFMGADVDEVVIGPSTTQLYSNLSMILPHYPPGTEFILSRLDHEANISAWVRTARLNPNITIKWWPEFPEKNDSSPATITNPTLTPENLRPLLSANTRLVCCTHTSNVLGGIHPIAAIAAEVHCFPSARLCVDGVALAPHRQIDMKALGVDYYSFSWYKVYGPHIAILYASRAVHAELGSLGHYFHGTETLSARLGLAGASYELVAALPKIVEYLGGTKQKPAEAATTTPAEMWEGIAVHEERLQRILLDYLRSKAGQVTIYGYADADREKRVPVISFTVKGRSSRDIVERIEAKSNFGCRWGHFYSKRMVDDLLGLGFCDGVVRVSMVHYNTEDEVRKFVQVLDEVLAT